LLTLPMSMAQLHGMPFNGPGAHTRFYTTTHGAADSAFIGDLPAMNEYIASVSDLMREGTSSSEGAVCLPLEDGFMTGELPDEHVRPSARWHREMHYARFPIALKPYRPL
jgi:hypothetical protein